MYRGKSIEELTEQLEKKETTKEELFQQANFLADHFQKDYNCFVTILDQVKSKRGFYYKWNTLCLKR